MSMRSRTAHVRVFSLFLGLRGFVARCIGTVGLRRPGRLVSKRTVPVILELLCGTFTRSLIERPNYRTPVQARLELLVEGLHVNGDSNASQWVNLLTALLTRSNTIKAAVGRSTSCFAFLVAWPDGFVTSRSTPMRFWGW